MQFEGFADFRSRRNIRNSNVDKHTTESGQSTATPEEIIETAHKQLREDLASELLQQIMRCDADFFERLVVELLLKMGYGGSREDAGKTLGRSGDGGVDGIINEDRLGLDVVYLQAKRWEPERSVGRPEIQRFAGALQGQRARKGVFITTARFTREAREYAESIATRIVLVDGERLVNLMIDFGLGVSTTARYELKRIDSDFFELD